jgi:hypothetical protein
MPEGFFSPLHILIVLFSALIVLGLPLLAVLLLVRWANKRQQPQPGTRISIPGVLIGGITDVVSSSILGVPLVIYVTVKFDLLNSPRGHDITSMIHATPWLYGLQLAIGLGCSVLGGYVAAWIAKHDELLNGLLSSFLCTAIGLYSILLGKDSQSLLAQILLLAAAPAFAFLGGYLRQTQKRISRTPGTAGPFA